MRIILSVPGARKYSLIQWLEFPTLDAEGAGTPNGLHHGQRPYRKDIGRRTRAHLPSPPGTR